MRWALLVALVVVCTVCADCADDLLMLDEEDGLANRGRDLSGYYYFDYEVPPSPPPTLEECTAHFSSEAATWANDSLISTYNGSLSELFSSGGFTQFFDEFMNNTVCFQFEQAPSPGQTTPLALYADLTWALALQQQHLDYFLIANPKWTRNTTVNSYFTSLDDLQAQVNPFDKDAVFYAAVVDSQQQLYQGGLDDSVWGKGSAWEADNAQVLKRGVGPLFPRTYMMLFYRKDIFDLQGLAPPDTWDQLLDAARQLNGTDGAYGICLDLGAMCKANFYLMAIAASIVQYRGADQGLWMDPDSMEPLVGDNAAMREAFRIFTALQALSPPASADTCMAWNVDFDQGRCAMTLEWDVMMHFMNRKSSKAKGNLGVSLLPGSVKVWDRLNDTLVPCNATLCPFATEDPRPSTSAGRHHRRRRRQALAVAHDLINRAPFSTFSSFDASTMPLLSIAGPNARAALRSLLNSLTMPYSEWLANRQDTMNFAVAKLRGEAPQWDSPPQGWNLSTQIRNTFSPNDLRDYYDELWRARWHPNPAVDIAIDGAPLYRIALEEAIRNVTSLGQPPEAVLPVLASRVPLVIAYVNYTSNLDYTNTYRRTLGIVTNVTIPSPPSPPAPPPYVEKHDDTAMIIEIVVPTVVAALLILGLLLGWWWHRRQRNHTMLGKVMAPSCNPDTTLLCTDIQNSTLLWETLDAAIMDVAVSTHHEVLRRSMYKRSGYLSAMEGDSFIIAFHNARSALLFAVEAQMGLLRAEWNLELLSAPDCQPVWVSPRGGRSYSTAADLNRPSGRAGSSLALSRGLLAEVSRSLFKPLLSHKNLRSETMMADATNAEWSRALGLRRTLYGNSARSFASVAEPLLPRGDNSCEFDAADEPLSPVSPVDLEPKKGGFGGGGRVARSLSSNLDLTKRATSMSLPQETHVEFGIVTRTGSVTGPINGQRDSMPATLVSRFARGSGPTNLGGLATVTPIAAENPLVAHLRTSATSGERRTSSAGVVGVELTRMSSSSPKEPATMRVSSNGSKPWPGAQPVANATLIKAAQPQTAPQRPSPQTTAAVVPPLPVSHPLPASHPPSQSSPELGFPHHAGTVTSQAQVSVTSEDGPVSERGTGESTAEGCSAAGTRVASLVQPHSGAPPRHAPMTWQEMMLEQYDVERGLRYNPADLAPKKGQVLVYNGIRVRMGLYSGIAHSSDIVFNQAAGNVQYSGESLEAVKAVATAAGGGMILLSGETYRKIGPQKTHLSAVVFYAGEFHLEDQHRQWTIYQASYAGLPQRVPLYDPVKCLATLQIGTPFAPVGVVTLVFMYVVGASTLMAELPEVAQEALATFHVIVSEELMRWGGYLVHAVDGSVQAAFGNTASAASWGLACHAALLRQDWDQELLAHEYCEEVFMVSSHTSYPSVLTDSRAYMPPTVTPKVNNPPNGRAAELPAGHPGGNFVPSPPPPPAPRRRVLMRGLRLKVGLDVGRPAPDVNPESGRMLYKGRVVNRASRIASKASAGHVVCSQAGWQDIVNYPSNMPAAASEQMLVSESLGVYNLKGILEPQELFDVTYAEPTDMPAPFNGLLWNGEPAPDTPKMKPKLHQG